MIDKKILIITYYWPNNDIVSKEIIKMYD